MAEDNAKMFTVLDMIIATGHSLKQRRIKPSEIQEELRGVQGSTVAASMTRVMCIAWRRSVS